MSCIAPATGTGFLQATLANLDCQAQTIGEGGYQALSAAGSPLALALSLLLALFVAIIGLRFLMGRPLGVEEWVSSALKVGFVLALAASWPAYKIVVYDLVLKAPAEVAGSIGRASALPGSEGGLAARLQGIDNGIMALVEAGSGRLDLAAARPTDAIAPPVTDNSALGWGKTLFVSSVIGSFGLLRLGGGLFLALAPLFAGFLLFDGTRFLFFGWLKALIAIALGSLGLAIILGVQLAIMEPWLSQVLALRASRIATLSAPFELFALSLSFALVMIGLFALVLRVAFALTVIMKVQAMVERAAMSLQQEASTWRPAMSETSQALNEQSRAQMVAQSLRQTLSLDGQGGGGSTQSNSAPSRAALVMGDRNAPEASASVPLGRTYPAPSRRVSNQALRRKTP